MNVKINQKNYVVPTMTFGEFARIEAETEVNIVMAVKKKQISLLIQAGTMFITGADMDEANHLIEQHFLGSGKTNGILEAFMGKLMDADFFLKMLGVSKEEEKKPKKGKVAETPEKTEE